MAENLGYLRRVSVRLTRNPQDGDDLLQDVLVKLLEKQTQLLAVSDAKPWMARVIRHQFIDRYRQLRREQALFVNTDQAADDDERSDSANRQITAGHDIARAAEDADDQDIREQVRGAIETLSGRQREVVEQHELEGFSLQEIAARYDMPVYTVKSMLARGRSRLRRALIQFRPEGDATVRLRRRPYTASRGQDRAPGYVPGGGERRQGQRPLLEPTRHTA
ncbi:MAG: hypothetical protein NVS9B10_06740 [Nevskia sp.]